MQLVDRKVSCEGYLYKRHRFFNILSRRYCVLENTRKSKFVKKQLVGMNGFRVELHFYKAEDEYYARKKPIYSITIKAFTPWEAKSTRYLTTPRQNGIKLKSTSRLRIFLYATTSAERTRWLNTLHRALPGLAAASPITNSASPNPDNVISSIAVVDGKANTCNRLLEKKPFLDPTCAALIDQVMALPTFYVYLDITSCRRLQLVCLKWNATIKALSPMLNKWLIRYAALATNHEVCSLWRSLSAGAKISMKYNQKEAKKWSDKISKDVRRTFGTIPPHKKHSSSEKLDALNARWWTVEDDEKRETKLFRVLISLASHYDDIGYCQGMDSIVAFCLQTLHDSEQHAYDLTCNLFDHYRLHEAFCPGMYLVKLHCFQLERLLFQLLPKLHQHFEDEGISTDMYCISWFQTLFVYCNAIPNEILMRIWTIFIMERSWKIFIRVALAIIYLAKDTLETGPIETIMRELHQLYMIARAPTALIPTALNIKVTRRMLRVLEEEYQKQ